MQRTCLSFREGSKSQGLCAGSDLTRLVDRVVPNVPSACTQPMVGWFGWLGWFCHDLIRSREFETSSGTKGGVRKLSLNSAMADRRLVITMAVIRSRKSTATGTPCVPVPNTLLTTQLARGPQRARKSALEARHWRTRLTQSGALSNQMKKKGKQGSLPTVVFIGTTVGRLTVDT